MTYKCVQFCMKWAQFVEVATYPLVHAPVLGPDELVDGLLDAGDDVRPAHAGGGRPLVQDPGDRPLQKLPPHRSPLPEQPLGQQDLAPAGDQGARSGAERNLKA